MREFFKGWRRKLGCGLLLMACCLGAAWARSVFVSEAVSFGFAKQTHLVISDDGKLMLYRFRPKPLMRLWQSVLRGEDPAGYQIRTGKVGPAPFYAPFSYVLDEDGQCIPYWSIVLPLALLSAYLILWKPRPKPKDKPHA